MYDMSNKFLIASYNLIQQIILVNISQDEFNKIYILNIGQRI